MTEQKIAPVLSDRDIGDAYEKTGWGYLDSAVKFARAIEQAVLARVGTARDQALDEAANACTSTMLMNVDSYCGATAHSCADRIRALKATPAAAVADAQPIDWCAVEKVIDEYVADYEMVGEDEAGREGWYAPNETERALIKDAVHGLLAEDDLMRLLRPCPGAAAPVADAQGGFAQFLAAAERDGVKRLNPASLLTADDMADAQPVAWREEIAAILAETKKGPPTKDGCCLTCGQWTPYLHREAHDHAHGCTALARMDWRARLHALLAQPSARAQPSTNPGPLAAVEQDAKLPTWWSDFIRNVCELPDLNSPEGEPDAMIATAEELENAALVAIAASKQGEPK